VIFDVKAPTATSSFSIDYSAAQRLGLQLVELVASAREKSSDRPGRQGNARLEARQPSFDRVHGCHDRIEEHLPPGRRGSVGLGADRGGAEHQ
jgi:hypothetical protein